MSNTLKDGQLLLKNGRLGYPKLFTPEPIKGDPNAKQGIRAPSICRSPILKRKRRSTLRLNALRSSTSKARFRKRVTCLSAMVTAEDGDSNTSGYWMISANRAESQKRPQVVDKDGRTPIDSQDTKMYPGCRVNLLVDVFKPNGWDRICCGLEIVQWVADDEPFGAGTVKAEDVMPDLSEEDEDI